jgi:hypothetical protein
MRTESDAAARTGVLVFDAPGSADAVLRAAVPALRARGLAVGGLLQRAGDPTTDTKCAMWLDDIVTGQGIRLDQPRGTGATACVLDPDALAQGACLLRQAVDTGMDVIIINRFGNAEADGRGLREEIAEAVFSGAVVLIAVRTSLLPDLEGFLGGSPTILPISEQAVIDWTLRAATLPAETDVTQQTGANRDGATQ